MKKLHSLFAGMTVVAALVAACGPAATPTTLPTVAATQAPPTDVPPTMEPTAEAVEPTAEPTMEATAEPTAEPTAEMVELGTEEHPIIFALAPSATSETLLASGEELGALLSAETGLVVKVVVPTNYKAMIEAMCSGNAQMGALPPFAYLVAHQTMVKQGDAEVPCADVGYISIRNESDHYATQYIGAASAFTITDPTDIANLQLVADKKPCWTDQFSASGYVIPASLLASEGVKTRTAAFVQGHPTVVRAVYAGGICDFGATFVDARTGVEEALPDVMEKVVVIYQTENIIPNDTWAFAYDVTPEMREKLAAAFDTVAKSEAGAAALKTVYSIDGLKAVDDTFFDEFRVLLAASGIDVAALVR